MTFPFVMIFITMTTWVALLLRIRTWRNPPERVYPLSQMLWPLLWVALHRGMEPIHEPTLFDVARISLMVMVICDLVHYYGLQWINKRYHRLAMVGLIVWILPMRWYVLPGDKTPFTLPFSGHAIALFEGTTHLSQLRFVLLPSYRANNLQTISDWNSGRPVFSPWNGKVLQIKGAWVQLIREDRIIEMGPLMPESLQIESGSEVFSGQPLGILEVNDTPGLTIRFIKWGFGCPRFQAGMSGRLLAHELSGSRIFPYEYVHATTGQGFK